jgi:Reverse transcriptase (RNA-dependent DNA polymerase)/Endonuclease/Exonuclease/phosphatase family
VISPSYYLLPVAIVPILLCVRLLNCWLFVALTGFTDMLHHSNLHSRRPARGVCANSLCGAAPFCLSSPFLHSLHVLSGCIFLLHIFLVLCINLNLYSDSLPLDSSYESSYYALLPYYQPVPCASICSCLNTVKHFQLTNESVVSAGLQTCSFSKISALFFRPYSSRHSNFLCVLLLILAGDVNLNPGPNDLKSLKFSHFNIRSALSVTLEVNKPVTLQDFILSKDLDILTLSETWLSSDSPSYVLNSLTPTGYALFHVPRPNKTGGGLAAIYRSIFNISQITLPSFPTFEAMCMRITLPSSSLTILSVYRPPSSSKPDFISDFSTLLEDFVSQPSEILITGDFNFHVDPPVPQCDTQFLTCLDTFSLIQHIGFPTHTSCHTLDLLITRSSSKLITSVTFDDPGLSDHMAILCTLEIPARQRPARITKTVRNYRSIDIDLFSQDILASSLFSSPATGVEPYLDQFNSTLSEILDMHAPIKSVCYTPRTNKPFFTEEIRKERSKRSKLETIYRRTHLASDLHKFKAQARLVAKLLTSARRTYFKSLISNSANQPKKLWSSLDSLLSRSTPDTFPHTSSPSSIASSFLDYFNSKANSLSAAFPPNDTLPEDLVSLAPSSSLCSFAPTSPEEVRAAILSSSNASCSLDIIPTFLLKSCLHVLLSPITTIINLSLSEGNFPGRFKHAIVRPKLKKTSMPPQDLSSYRPISNLNFISKILERIIFARINSHLQSFPSISSFQSAYRKFHSTETALLKITNDLLIASNEQKVTALILLDLSAAFDTVDHRILLHRLSTTFGITGTAHQLLSSYLQDRSQAVQISDQLSPSLPLSTGVPQGSVLGPLLFCLYTSPLASNFNDSPVSPHFYADDSQLYISFTSADAADSLSKLSATLDSTYDWFTTNRLSVNPSKTEYLLIGTPQQRAKVVSPSITFRGNTLTPSSEARNLGIIFDSCLSLTKHISSVCSSSFYQIRQLRQVRPSLDKNSTIILANALVTTKLDYCNSLFYNLPASAINRLQRVQNALARVVVPAVRRSQHITPVLRNLHWLPIPQRVIFKIASLTFKILHHKQPTYLANLLHPYIPRKDLRSSDQNLLSVPSVKSAIGRRAFSYAAPVIWNSLPPVLRASATLSLFLSKLKTHLFPP